MRNILLIAMVLLGNCAIAQNINAIEYFFDTDPGIDNGTLLTLTGNTSSLTQTFSIPTTGLDDGFHSLYVRSKTTNGEWSLYDRTAFLIRSFSDIAQPLNGAEYFFDTDPGAGNGTAIALDSNTGNLTQTLAVPITGLAKGFHSFYIRAKNTKNLWSLYDRIIFFIDSFVDEEEPLISAEYFYDTDPGAGNGTTIALDTNTGKVNQSILLPTNSLANGIHTVYIRVRTQGGNWSLYDHKSFTVSTATIDNSVTLNDVTLTATFNDTGTMYQWLDCSNGGTIIENATDRSFTPLISGNYAVSITFDAQTVLSECIQIDVQDNPDDGDNDGILNAEDNCPLTANTDQTDTDNDGIGDVCDDDMDNDGVPDALDACNDTPPNAIVDFNGCEIFSLPANNFTIKSIGESCISSNNGSIEIEVAINLNYTASLTNEINTLTASFTANTIFTDLRAGDYTLCIEVEGQTDFERCFDIIISEPESLSVSSKIDITNSKLTLNLSGGKLYTIQLNDAVYTTLDSEIILPLDKVENTLSVRADKDCQGIYEKTIVQSSEIFIYPNPVSNGELTIYLGSSDEFKRVETSLYNVNGTKVLDKVAEPNNGYILLNMDGLSKGTYLLNIKTKKSLLNYKIIKR
ncbi:thrombospondin type 3 repeat-containing protein [Maribacter sp. 2304DJ31-5]|uniref:thrombospondin type 3 repeat-containing protein n=1 Tax=Maribacter sp. 2304DJ31-5 TaxID=3386273 RepID=UPI0039BC67EC